MNSDVRSKLNIGRVYRIKNPARQFLCALCETPREVYYSKNLSAKNYLQILVLSLSFSWALWPFMGAKGLNIWFIVWASFELVNKLLYRKEIACPHCGFDATWYRRNVKVAKKKVENFWQRENQDSGQDLSKKLDDDQADGAPVEAKVVKKGEVIEENYS